MLLDWLLLTAGLVGFGLLVANAGRLAARPKRGTAWAPSRTGWFVIALAPLLIAVGALLNLIG